MWKCKYCNKTLIELKLSDGKGVKANHTRWCIKNPNRNEYVEKLRTARDSITEESIVKRVDKIKQAWQNGSYKNVDHGKAFRGKTHTDESKEK